MRNYFPDMVRNIDLKAEVARASSLTFARETTPEQSAQLSTEDLNRRRRSISPTLPDDTATLAQLTDGERLIADRNPRAAEAAFKNVLVKYPDQISRLVRPRPGRAARSQRPARQGSFRPPHRR